MYYNFLLQQCNHLDPFVVNTEKMIANLIWNYTYKVWCSIDQFKTVDLLMLVWISIRPINSPDKFLINQKNYSVLTFSTFHKLPTCKIPIFYVRVMWTINVTGWIRCVEKVSGTGWGGGRGGNYPLSLYFFKDRQNIGIQNGDRSNFVFTSSENYNSNSCSPIDLCD